MSRLKDKGRLQPFVAVDREMMRTPAWRAMSCGARILYIHLKLRWRSQSQNNGRLYLSHRNAQQEMGGAQRDSIGRWFRELQHYGFIVKTADGSLGVDGMGKAPHWRITEANAPGGRNGDTWMLPTRDYLKWDGTKFHDDRGAVKRRAKKQNPGLQTQARVACKPRPGLACKPRPLPTTTGLQTQAISDEGGGLQTQAISRSTSLGGRAGSFLKEQQGTKLPWSTPQVIEVTDPVEIAAIRRAIEAQDEIERAKFELERLRRRQWKPAG
jgi:hypothetical protein